MVAWRCFCRIWPEYPRTDNKVGAWRRFRGMSGFKKLAEDIIEDLGWRAAHHPDWRRGIGIPYFKTYLGDRRWEDERRASVPREAAPVLPEHVEPSETWQPTLEQDERNRAIREAREQFEQQKREEIIEKMKGES
ncbi:MAG: hypothetical protein GY722_18930 [bacterium]|nr:hypothetical protein [bacterium]